MQFLGRFIEWAEGFVHGGAKVCEWLFTSFEIPEWLWNFGYFFTPIHFMNLLIDHFSMSPIEFISISGLIGFVGICIFQWIVK